MLDVWKAAAPAIDLIAPDIYVRDYISYQQVCESYGRPDNPLLIPETGGFGAYARYMFYALADYDSLGFSPFGIDRIGAGTVPEGVPGVSAGTSLAELVRPMMDNYRLLGPRSPRGKAPANSTPPSEKTRSPSAFSSSRIMRSSRSSDVRKQATGARSLPAQARRPAAR